MRDIKIKVWDDKLKCFGHGCRNQLTDRNDYVLLLSDTAIGFKNKNDKHPDTVLNFNKCSYREILNDTDRYKIVQYTGLKDANEKEIYEGDLVKTNGFDKNKIFEIKFMDGCFCIGKVEDVFILSDYYVTIRDAMFQAKRKNTKLKLTIIGNIYENQELL